MRLKHLYVASLIALVLVVSVLVMILPTWYTAGISRTALHTKIDLPLVMNDEKEVKLIFFGYAGCADICTPRLLALDTFYSSLDEATKKKVGVEFLDISVPKDKAFPERFVTSINPEFKGIYLSGDVLRDYTKAFDVFFSPSLLRHDEYDHTAHLYLLKKTGNIKELRYIYSAFPYDYKQITLDIKELLDE